MRALVSLVLGGLLLNLSAQATQEVPTKSTDSKNVPTHRGFEDTDYHEQKMEEAPENERRWRGHIFEKNPKEYRGKSLKKKPQPG